MKKFILLAIIGVITLDTYSQNFGVKTGVDFATAKAKFDGLTLSDNETGFYIGLFTKLSVSENFNIRPEANFISIKDLNQIQIPVLAEIELSDKFDILAGPSFGLLLNSEEGEKSFNIGLNFGLSYNITEHFLIETRYVLGISNLAEDNEFDASFKLSGFQVGIGYLF